MSRYYILNSTTDDPIQLNAGWTSGFLSEHAYACGHRDFSYVPDGILVDRRSLVFDDPVTFTARISFDLLRRDFRAALGTDVTDLLELRYVFDQDGEPVNEYQFIGARPTTVLRGGKQSYFWRCAVCSQSIYDACGRLYLIESDIPDQAAFTVDSGEIVLHKSVIPRISSHAWNNLVVRELPVRSEANDGFAASLYETTKDLERRWMPRPEAF